MKSIFSDKSRVAQKLEPTLKLLFLALLLGFVFWRLAELDWSQLIKALPESPLYYLVVLLHFLLIPVSEIKLFTVVWPAAAKITAFEKLALFLKKQALNDTLFGYSGDAFVAVWGEKRLGLPKGQVAHGVKDNALISAAVSSALAIIVVVSIAIVSGVETLSSALDLDEWMLGLGAAFALIVALFPIVLVLNKRIVKLPPSERRKVAGLHLSRQSMSECLLLLQWVIAVPGVTLEIWFSLLAAKMVVTRVPFLPNRELVLLALALSLAAAFPDDLPEATIAALFLARASLMQILNLGVLGIVGTMGLRGQSASDGASDDGGSLSAAILHQSDAPSDPVHN